MAKKIYHWLDAEGKERSSPNLQDVPTFARWAIINKKEKYARHLRKIRRVREARAQELRKNKPKG